MRTILLTVALIGSVRHLATGQEAKLDSPPMILNLGSNDSDGSITATCTGSAPYARLSCTIYRLWIDRPSPESQQKSRDELRKDLDLKSDSDIKKEQRGACSNFHAPADIANALKGFSPGRAASARNGFETMQQFCNCTTKQCIASATLERQAHEQNECTVHSAVFSSDFVRVSERKWASNNGPEGLCGVVSVFTIEHEPKSSVLWTYTEHYTYTNNTEGLCKGLPKGESSTYSWNSGSSVRLRCEEIKFDGSPEAR